MERSLALKKIIDFLLNEDQLAIINILQIYISTKDLCDIAEVLEIMKSKREKS